MSYAAGVAWSLAAAVSHSAIDVLRKLGSARMQPADLIALASLYDAVIATIGVAIADDGLPAFFSFPDKHRFFAIVFVTATLAAAARLLYQRALSIAPLSLTVPYLAFTPAFVVLVSPLFLVGEVPTPMGFAGVLVVSISGYLLGLVAAAPGSSHQPSSPSKNKVLPTMAITLPSRNSWSAGPQKQHQHHITVQQLQQQQPQASLQQHHDERQAGAAGTATGGCTGQSGNISSSRSHQSSIWAMTYYKHKAPQANASNTDSAPVHLYATAASVMQPVPGSMTDLNSTDSSIEFHSQAKELKDKPSRANAVRMPRLLQGEPSSKYSVRQRWSRLLAAAASPKAAPAMVLIAALLYSITASLDKLGIAAAGNSLSSYFLAQRLLIGVVGLVYLVCFSRGAFRHIFKDPVLLFSISLVEQGSVVFYLLAIENLLVSYVVAIKRVNVLLSTLGGCMLFKEQVGKRIPYIVLMLCGMLLIVLQPGHEDLHHSHHTRLHKA